MARSLADLNVRIGAKVEGFDKAFRQIEGNMKRVSRNVTAFGDSITRNIALPFGAALVAGIKLGTDLETNFSKIENLVGVAGDQLDQFKVGVKSISSEVAQSQQNLSKALFTITSAGVRGSEALDILESSAKATAVGLGDTQEIARATTAIIQAYGAENINAAQATETLFKTVREGNLEASELAPKLGSVIGVAAAMGVEFAEVGANVATFTRLGVSADEAITGLKSVLTTFLNPGKAARDALAEFGISADDVRSSIADNGLAATLISLNEKLDGNYDALGAVIPNVRALGNIMGVAGNQAGEYQRIVASLSEDTDELGKAFENVTDNAGFKFQKALVSLQNASIKLGAVVIPMATKIAERVTMLAEAFSNLSPAVQSTIVNVLGFVSGIGIAASVAGRLIGGVATMIRSYRLLTVWLAKSKLAQAALNFVMNANPIGLIITGVSLLVGALILAYNKSEKFRAVLHGIGAVAFEVFNIIKEAIGGFVDAFNSFSDGDFKKGISQFGDALVNSNPIGIALTQGERLGGAFVEGYASQISSEIEDATIKAVKINTPPEIKVPITVTQSADLGSAGGGSSGETGEESAQEIQARAAAVNTLATSYQNMSSLYGESIGFIADRSAAFAESLDSSMIAIRVSQANMVSSALGGFSAILNGIQSIAGKSKGLALLEVAVNSAIGVSRAIAAGAGQVWPANIAAIGSGVAAVLGGIGQARSLLKKAPALAKGGLAYGPTYAMVGDNPGASINPEVIAPLDKLKSMINQGGGNINVTGRLIGQGSDLYAIIDGYQSERGRFA